MKRKDQHRPPGRFTTGVAVALAVALPGSFLALTQSPASAAPLPATYSADAHADIVDLSADLLAHRRTPHRHRDAVAQRQHERLRLDDVRRGAGP